MSRLVWIPLTERTPPEKCPPFLVTNNLGARNAYGHMSHVWLVPMIHEWKPGERDNNGRSGLEAYGRFVAFDDRSVRLHNLTHWADPFGEGDVQPPPEVLALLRELLIDGNVSAVLKWNRENNIDSRHVACHIPAAWVDRGEAMLFPKLAHETPVTLRRLRDCWRCEEAQELGTLTCSNCEAPNPCGNRR